MPRTKEHSLPTRQLYASIREDIYLAAKAKAMELRLPMRRFIEDALLAAVAGGSLAPETDPTERPDHPPAATPAPPSVWDDPRLNPQTRQPIGSPIDLSDDEAKNLALAAFDAAPEAPDPQPEPPPEPLTDLMREWNPGDQLTVSDEDAASIALSAFMPADPEPQALPPSHAADPETL